LEDYRRGPIDAGEIHRRGHGVLRGEFANKNKNQRDDRLDKNLQGN
jgi:hypothetical protein